MTRAGPEIVLLLAAADNGVIGADGVIPWHIPGEQKRFKAMTMGTPMVMGRRTFDSLPGLLPGRRHIVLTRDRAWTAAGAEIVHDVEAAVAAADGPVLSVIGGAEIYRLFEPVADRIELTQVHLTPAGDAHIALPDPARWREAAREDMAAQGDVPAYSYVTLVRP
ncbi:MAG TPA: dihydrofolate reductase [Sphingobium sp.]|nr:dihydrofolate reductase [Sphingobium sp.]